MAAGVSSTSLAGWMDPENEPIVSISFITYIFNIVYKTP